jgi:hypothetical protein
VALANYPEAPIAVTKVDTLSSLTSMYVQWESNLGDELYVLGYELWMDNSDGYFQL